MFQSNPDNMRMEPTPERVLSVCRLVAHQDITREEVYTAMTLGAKDDKGVAQIRSSIGVALEELHLIETKDNKLTLAVDPNVIETADSFRRYVSSVAFSKKDTTFYLFTKWLISQNEKIFSLRTWEGLAKACGSEVGELSAINENAVLGWRFWAAFLGIGYLYGTMMIPNMKIRLQDVFVTSFPGNFNYDESIRATDFIAWLENRLPEVDMTTNRLPLALSSGLRTLHELNFIHLETWRDSNRIMLYPVDGDPLNDFSHITVKEAITK